MKRITIMVLLTLTVCLLYSCINDEQTSKTSKTQEKIEYFYTYDILWINDKPVRDEKLGGERSIQTVIKNGIKNTDDFDKFGGLTIKVAHKVADDSPMGYSLHEEYLQYDDEANYDSTIYEWWLAYNIAYDLYDWNRTYKPSSLKTYFKTDLGVLAALLSEVRNLPSRIDESDMDYDFKEIFKENYYDLKGATIYAPQQGYGYRNYPYKYASSSKPKNSIRIIRHDKLNIYRHNNDPKYDTPKVEGVPDGAIIITSPYL